MRKLVGTSLLLVIVLVVLSAYIRLDHSGIGCTPWPACYGNIGVPVESTSAADAYERLLDEAREPLSWTTPLHRLVASVLGLSILAMTVISVTTGRDWLITGALLGLTVFLAWLGIYSGGLHDPGVVMGNLAGGFAMLGLLGWMLLRKKADDASAYAPLRNWTLVAIIVLGVQILLGGLTSANFAASACRTLPDCHGSYLPGPGLSTAFDLTREHDVGETGMVLGGPERAAIHKLHRLVALAALAAVLVAGLLAVRAGADLRTVGIVVIVLAAGEVSLGATAILTDLPIGVAVAHNWIAALLLLGLLKLYAEARAGSG